MSVYTSTDRDPHDRGIFRAPPKAAGPRGRRRPVELTEGRLTPPDAGRSVVLSGLDGRPVSDERKAAARSVTELATGAVSHAARVSTSGPDSGQLLDPLGASFQPGDLGLIDPRNGRPRYEFRTVSEAVYLDYLGYLSRHNQAALRRAQRAMLHG